MKSEHLGKDATCHHRMTSHAGGGRCGCGQLSVSVNGALKFHGSPIGSVSKIRYKINYFLLELVLPFCNFFQNKLRICQI